jgi:hypothetical protein
LDLNEKINACNCNLKKVDEFIANEFLKENDLKDFYIYDKSYGVFYKDVMIAIIVFKSNIIRFILKIDIDIVGDLKIML